MSYIEKEIGERLIETMYKLVKTAQLCWAVFVCLFLSSAVIIINNTI